MTTSRFPGYDVQAKRDTPSWDAVTREVIDARLAATDAAPRFLAAAPWRALLALCACVIPQEAAAQDAQGAAHVPAAALVDAKLLDDRRDGYRDSRLPPLREAWTTGLAALDAESERIAQQPFADLDAARQRELIAQMQRGELRADAWRGMPSDVFFAKRVLHDICAAFYSHPAAWSALGFGGPANPRGYVRLYTGRRDPWESVEAEDESDAAQQAARRRNAHVR